MAVARMTAAATDSEQTSPEQIFGPCSPDMPQQHFRTDAELKVLVTRFSGADGSPSSIRFGAALGTALQRLLPVYLRKAIDATARKAGMRVDSLHAEYVPCLVTSHDSARRIGDAWGADLVIWGTAQSSIDQDAHELLSLFERKLSGLRVASDNVINAPGAQEINIKGVVNIRVLPQPISATFQTSMTVVSWDGIESDGAGGSVSNILDQDFPRLATEQPLALFHYVLGNSAYQLSRFSVAARFFRLSTESAFADAEHQEFLYWRVSQSYIIAGFFSEGLGFAQKALESCGGEVRCVSLYENNLGWALKQSGRADEALVHYQSALALSRSAHYGYVEATALNNLAGLYMESDPKKALQMLNDALPIRQREADSIGEGSTLHNIGMAYVALADKAAAFAYLEKALPVRRRAKDLLGEAATLRVLGDLYTDRSELPEALRAWDQAHAVNKVLGHMGRELAIQQGIWTVARRMRNGRRADEAAATFRNILRSNNSLIDQIGDPGFINNNGKMLYDLGEFRMAILWYNRALDIYKRQKSKTGEWLSYNNIGKALYALGQYKQALSYYERARPLLKTDSGKTYRPYLLHNFGLVHDALHDPRNAVRYYEQALSLRREQPNKGETSETLIALAGSLTRLGQIDEAIAHYREAASLMLGDRWPDRDSARRCFEQALQIAERARQPDLMNALRTDLNALDN